MTIKSLHKIAILETLAMPIEIEHMQIPIAKLICNESNLVAVILDSLMFRKE
jgi:hypothetical protein